MNNKELLAYLAKRQKHDEHVMQKHQKLLINLITNSTSHKIDKLLAYPSDLVQLVYGNGQWHKFPDTCAYYSLTLNAALKHKLNTDFVYNYDMQDYVRDDYAHYLFSKFILPVLNEYQNDLYLFKIKKILEPYINLSADYYNNRLVLNDEIVISVDSHLGLNYYHNLHGYAAFGMTAQDYEASQKQLHQYAELLTAIDKSNLLLKIKNEQL